MKKKDFNKLLLFSLCLCLCLSISVSATTYTVNSTTDASDNNVGDGICDDGSGNCTLRAALEEANSDVDDDIINVPAGTYTLTLNTELTISSNIILSGAGASTTIIQASTTEKDATNGHRVLAFSYGNFAGNGENGAVTVQGLTIRHGYVNGNGAGINVGYTNTNPGYDDNVSFFKFTNLIVTKNHTHSNGNRDGGGIYITGRWYNALKIKNCIFSDNSTMDEGGGMYLSTKASSVIVEDCVFSNNEAGDNGGGVRMYRITINYASFWNRCVFSNNTATNDGGGMSHKGNRAVFINSTIIGNNASKGGGYFNDAVASDTIHMLNTTIVNNTVTDANGGGGIYINSEVIGGLELQNCLIADNTANGTDNDLHIIDFSTNDVLPSTNIVEVATEGDGTDDYPNVFITVDPSLSSGLACQSNGLIVAPISASSSAENSGNGSFTNFSGKDLGVFSPLTSTDLDVDYSKNYTGAVRSYSNLKGASYFHISSPTKDACGVARSGNPDLGAYEVGSALPVELTLFKGNLADEIVQLTWQTASERNNLGFEIERSSDGEQWKSIDFVTGNGTTTKTQEYSFSDYEPILGQSYYRLKQIDYDGGFEYSDVVTINYKDGAQKVNVKLFPNPIVNELQIIDGIGEATIFNAMGQVIRELTIDNGQLSINVSDLPKGQYILHISKENGNMITKRFVK